MNSGTPIDKISSLEEIHPDLDFNQVMRLLLQHRARAIIALTFVAFSFLDFALDLWVQASSSELEMIRLSPATPLTVGKFQTDSDSSPVTSQDEDCFCCSQYVVQEQPQLRPVFFYVFPLNLPSSDKVPSADLVSPYHPPRA